jgi:gamma-glutamylcysteine synthetase
MALTATEKKDIEVMIRKEIKDFFGSHYNATIRNKLIDTISKELKRGKLEGDVKDIALRMFREFYQFMWTNRSYWEPRLKNA